jgi:hypothetical protein
MGRFAGRIGERQRDHLVDHDRWQGQQPGLAGLVSRTKLATPSRMDRSCQRQTQGLDTSARRMISAVPQPWAVARMILARHTCFCGLFRSATIRSSRSGPQRSLQMLIPSRMPQRAMIPSKRESSDCVKPLDEKSSPSYAPEGSLTQVRDGGYHSESSEPMQDWLETSVKGPSCHLLCRLVMNARLSKIWSGLADRGVQVGPG